MRRLVLGLRLIGHGGRAGAIRAVSLALGVAVAVGALLALLSVPGVVETQRIRDGELLPIYATEDDTASAPIRAVYSVEGIDGRELTTIAVARTGTTPAERPGWLPRWPGDGEVVMSPALSDLVEVDDLAADRFPQRIVGEIGRSALAAPDSLVAVTGAPLDAFDPRSGIESFGRGPDGGTDVRAVRLAVAAVSLFVIAPIAALVASSARLSARTNERRLSSLRLVGLSARQTRQVVAAETATIALVGGGIGAAAWAVLRPVSQPIGAGSLRWWADDITLPPLTMAAVVAAIVAIASTIAIVGAAPAVDRPLGSRRDARAPAPSRWRLATLGAGLGLLATSFAFAGSFADDNAWFAVFALGNVLTAIGLVAAVPTLGRTGAVVLERFRRSPSAMLAARRLRHEPTAIGRVIAGMLIVVFSGGFAQALLVAFDFAYTSPESSPAAGEGPTVLGVYGHHLDIEPLEAVAGTANVVVNVSDDADDIRVLVADCDTLATISPGTSNSDCDDAVAQPLRPGFFDRVDAPASAREMNMDAATLGAPLRALGYDGRIGPPTPSEIFLGTAKEGSTPGGDVRVSPDLIDTDGAPVATAFVVLDDTADPELVVARIRGLQPASQISGLADIEGERFAGTYRTLVNAAIAFTLLVSLTAAAMAATDRAIERRRNAAHLAALGVPARVQRRAELLTTATPLAAGLVVAVAAAAVSGSAYLEWGEPGLRIPFLRIGAILAVGLMLSAIASVAAAGATATTPTADRLRTE